MGMPVAVEIIGAAAGDEAFDETFAYFDYIDGKFSTYKDNSEISKINRKEIMEKDWSKDMKEIFYLSEKTKQETGGFFNIKTPGGKYDPSGIVKGWAIRNAAKILEKRGLEDFYVEAGGDIQTSGKNEKGKKWRIGIRNPFDKSKIVKVIAVSGEGVATSGTYERGEHIYNPKNGKAPTGIVSLTVVGPNVYEADRFATAAFAMGKEGINFIEKTPDLEGYMIDKNGTATMTSGFSKYAV